VQLLKMTIINTNKFAFAIFNINFFINKS